MNENSASVTNMQIEDIVVIQRYVIIESRA